MRTEQYCISGPASLAADEDGKIRLAPCNASALEQRWTWTRDNQLLNGGNFMCLAGTGEDTKLQPCSSDAKSQHWRCAGSFIVQPSTGYCLTSDLSKAPSKPSFEDALDRALLGEGAPYPAVVLRPCSAKREEQKWDAQITASPDGPRAHICSHAKVEHGVAQCEIHRLCPEAMGWITCESLGFYVHGVSVDSKELFYRSIQCCSTSHVFSGREDGPEAVASEECQLLEAGGSFECPQGTFLKGFYFLEASAGPKFVKCCRPNTSSQLRYLHCTTDLFNSTHAAGDKITCRLPGYIIAGITATKCSDGYGCSSDLKCCI